MLANILRRLSPMERVCGAILVSRKWDGLDYISLAPNSTLSMSRQRIQRMRTSGLVGETAKRGAKCAQ